jgi:hypothetical protein
MKTDIHLWSYLFQFFLQRETFQTKKVENNKTHVILNKIFRKSCRLGCNVEKYYRAGQATYKNKAHAYFLQDN